jgi:ribonuclease BN (tRNA processing enzyme)
MRVVFLGTGGYYTNDHRHTAGIFLPEAGVLLDAGTSVYRLPEYLQTRNLHIFLTHAHLDHIIGLTYLLVPMVNDQLGQVFVYGRGETLKAVQDYLFAEPIFPKQPGFQYRILQPSVEIPDGGKVTHIGLKHPGGSVGYRIDWATRAGSPRRSLAYITDTSVDDSYADFIQGVDLLIHECYFSDDMAKWSHATGHSHTTRVAQLARQAAVGRLMLVHINPLATGEDPVGIERARAIFPNSSVAEDLLQIEL